MPNSAINAPRGKLNGREMGASSIDAPDYTGDEALAHRLAGHIKAYWNARGKYPRVWVEERFDGRHGEATVFIVRSDLVAGRPQR